ncbi:hypothetical protein SAMN05216337_1017139 [Bradyrhizobium brasilense]|uniref:Uncharacterized protein n=1 Tax=Bradyrhizobium brasilense TaxID=1419277 RepID=A0A1G6YXZ0_9BRAD|nr:hypothetical protein [Bradyrhizobium brasilense]SDD95230.1 hypothetical protein SAMN05216337_1017139 [Bradyrhizobium brasilense]
MAHRVNQHESFATAVLSDQQFEELKELLRPGHELATIMLEDFKRQREERAAYEAQAKEAAAAREAAERAAAEQAKSKQGGEQDNQQSGQSDQGSQS